MSGWPVWAAAYWLVMSLVSFGQMYADKRSARSSRRRIPERRLLLWALLGGAAGGWAGMRLFRHKTKHAVFAFGLPAMAILHAAMYIYAYSV